MLADLAPLLPNLLESQGDGKSASGIVAKGAKLAVLKNNEIFSIFTYPRMPRRSGSDVLVFLPQGPHPHAFPLHLCALASDV
jgi:hypothetical protein